MEISDNWKLLLQFLPLGWEQKAKELGLRHWRGVYGDEINRQNCRSLWFDNKQRIYRVSHLEDVS